MFTRRGLSGLTAGIAALAAGPAAAASGGADTIAELQGRLAKLPAKRDFKAVPLVLDTPGLWDDAAIREVAAYCGGPRQVWDNKDLAGGWTGRIEYRYSQYGDFNHLFIPVTGCFCDGNLDTTIRLSTHTFLAGIAHKLGGY